MRRSSLQSFSADRTGELGQAFTLRHDRRDVLVHGRAQALEQPQEALGEDVALRIGRLDV